MLEDIESAPRSGMAAVCSRTGAQWVNMTDAATVAEEFPGNVILKRIDVPRILRQTTLITVPVMKTHAKTGLTGALKNQWGCLSKMRHEYHLVLDDALADLNSAIRPALALMDGTVGLEGNGPKSGRSRIADRILCSGDPVALDTVQAEVMGLDRATVRHLATCAARHRHERPRAHRRARMDLAAARVPSCPRATTRSLGGDAAAPLRPQAPLLQHAGLRRVPVRRQALLPGLDAPAGGGAWSTHPGPSVYGPQWEGLRPGRRRRRRQLATPEPASRA